MKTASRNQIVAILPAARQQFIATIMDCFDMNCYGFDENTAASVLDTLVLDDNIDFSPSAAADVGAHDALTRGSGRSRMRNGQPE